MSEERGRPRGPHKSMPEFGGQLGNVLSGLVIMLVALACMLFTDAAEGQSTIAIFFAYCFILTGAGAVLVALVSQYFVRASQSWPSVEGTILRSEVGRESGNEGHRIYVARIEYEYVVKNRLYLCKKICVGGVLKHRL
jgi:hypothetical protein